MEKKTGIVKHSDGLNDLEFVCDCGTKLRVKNIEVGDCFHCVSCQIQHQVGKEIQIIKHLEPILAYNNDWVEAIS